MIDKFVNEMKGVVIKSTGSWYTVLAESGEKVECRTKGKLRLEESKATNPIAVGDNVIFQNDSIEEILPRKNYIIRKATNLSKQTHVIAANIDRAYLLVTLALPKTSTGFIDRFLMTAEAYQIPSTIIFNKTDIYTDEGLEELNFLKAIYEKIGYECFSVSAREEESVTFLKEKLKGKVNLVAGHSGVGKTTLINALQPGLDLKTAAISESNSKGIHTTTFAEMFLLDNGGFIIDTPGIKEFGVVNVEKNELSLFFPEIFKKSSECKFSSCLHVNEPKCAVIEAVEREEIAVTRYNSYLGIIEGDELGKKYND